MSAVPTSVVAEIERLGFEYTEVPQYDLSKLDPKRRVQVRESEHYAPKDEVQRYAVQMRQSAAAFPPIVVTADDYLLDGSTRTGACLLNDRKDFPAIVLSISFEGSTDRQKNMLRALGVTLNQLNGRSLTKKEMRENCRTMLELDWKVEQIARAIGMQPGVVFQVKKEINAETKLAKVGMGSNGDLRGASLRALGAPKALALNDAPYRDLATLAADAGLNAKEIGSAAEAVKEKGSESEQVAYLAGLRNENANRIRERQLTGEAKPPVSRQLRQRLGFVNKFLGNEAELVENHHDVIAQHIDSLKIGIDVLTKALDIQRLKATDLQAE